jgi:selenide, water dikinase
MEAVAIAAPTRLTQYSQGSGCGCKIEPELLAQIVAGVTRQCRPDDLLVGIEHSDDAAVFRLSDQQALVFTTDFFTPIVDDPYLYGKIAAANALSDIYAMGGEPLLANAIVGFPAGQIEVGVVQQIMRGGTDVCTEAGIPLAGGHTINNPQPIFGLSAVGMIHPDRLKTNATARKGDLLLLTKPLGLGILTTG